MAIKRFIISATALLFALSACKKDAVVVEDYKIINQSDYDITIQSSALGDNRNSLSIVSKDTFREVVVGNERDWPELELFRYIDRIDVTFNSSVKRSYTYERKGVIFENDREYDVEFLFYHDWPNRTYTFTNEDYQLAVRLMNEE